jgi:intracellular septation protein
MTDSPQRPPGPPRWLRPVLEFGPLVAFFATQRLTRDVDPHDLDGLWYGTIALMAALTVSLAVSRRIEGRWPVVPLITLVFVLGMGGLTLWLKDEQFIKQKPTIVNALFTAILGFGLLRRTYYVKAILGEAIELTELGWRTITVRLVLWFAFLAVLNEVLWRTLSTDNWTNFKVFGLPVLTFGFLMSLGGVISRNQPPRGDDVGKC